MVTLNDTLKNNIERICGESGVNWISRFPFAYDACREKWKLSQLEPLPNGTINFLGFAHSEEFGQVVIKMCPPGPAYRSEVDALWRLNPDVICKCLDTHSESNAMLLEQLAPGLGLNTVSNETVRLEVACQLITAVSVEMDPLAFFPTFDQWVEEAIAQEERTALGISAEHALSPWLDRMAEVYFGELVPLARPTCLLHGDLHHWNILSTASPQGWKVIDPKGVTGIRVLESARFIQNEVQGTLPEKRQAKIHTLTQLFGTALGESMESVAQAAFVDSVLGAFWTLQDGLPTSLMQRPFRVAQALWEFLQE